MPATQRGELPLCSCADIIEVSAPALFIRSQVRGLPLDAVRRALRRRHSRVSLVRISLSWTVTTKSSRGFYAYGG
ncbi:hypothetical protein [Streptomyces ipomoeae]|uniref:hypothetical protein n=1 Tax=Streptomyces ipomoeae TaxID=103232 RepID=UPI001FD4F315|nr:hypothetical protein [Streptomyces ipomoeae]MDX2939344.1 hypothetical protein [Streptomyces ipomoeae]